MINLLHRRNEYYLEVLRNQERITQLESEVEHYIRQLAEAQKDVSVAQAIESLRTAGYEMVIADSKWHYVVQITDPDGNTLNYHDQSWKDAIIDAASDWAFRPSIRGEQG